MLALQRLSTAFIRLKLFFWYFHIKFVIILFLICLKPYKLRCYARRYNITLFMVVSRLSKHLIYRLSKGGFFSLKQMFWDNNLAFKVMVVVVIFQTCKPCELSSWEWIIPLPMRKNNGMKALENVIKKMLTDRRIKQLRGSRLCNI